MLDDLDLAFEEESERRSRHRHRRSARNGSRGGGRGRERGRRGRTLAAFLLSLVILGVLALGGWWGFDRIQNFFTAPDYNSGGTGEVLVKVGNGDTAAQIGQTLQKQDVVKSAKAFVEAANKNPRSKEIQPGSYKVRQQMRATDALAMLLDRANRVVNGVTIPEGLITLQIYTKLAEVTRLPVEDFKKAAADPIALGVPDWWFNRLDKKPSAKSLEGFLFPATYELPPNSTAEQILRIMVKKFLDVTTKLDFVKVVQSERKIISPYQALIAASIAQAEVHLAADQAKAARAIYNRAYSGNFPCACLQLDSAVNYWFKIQGVPPKDPDDFKRSEIDNPNNPYNTHKTAGLPIGPLGNPGESALTAAMRPAEGTWNYWVTVDKQGTTLFSTTYAEFRRDVGIACKNGILSGNACRG